MKGKYGLLLVLLGVPVLTYLFLVGFGRNHYDLPKYYPIDASVAGDTSYYTLADEVKSILQVPSTQDHVLVWLHDDSLCAEHCAEASWSRIQDQISDIKGVVLVRTGTTYGAAANDTALFNETVRLLFDEHSFPKGTTEVCNRLCLIDKDGLIRGLYNACSREELDRLFLEIKVLNYKRD